MAWQDRNELRNTSFITITIIFMTVLCIYELYQGFAHFRTASLNKARDIADVTLAFRKWNSDIKDLYASTKYVEPNPYLDSPNRDINLNGTVFTKINPSYMTRMTSDVLAKSSSIRIRMVSHDPMNPVDKPLKWESKALSYIEKGNYEYEKLQYKGINNIMFYYARPVYVTSGCQSCHDYKKYKIGSIRGALSISFPVTAAHHKIFITTALTVAAYLLSASLVIFLIISSRRKLLKAYVEKLDTIKALEKEMERRKKSEAALVMQARSSSVSEMLSLIAHHWRQPLNNVGLLVQSMAEEEDKKELREQGLTANEIIQEMSETIDLFTSAVKPVKKEKLEIKEMVFDVLRLLKPELESAEIEAHVLCTLGGTETDKRHSDDSLIFQSCGRGNTKCEQKCGFAGLFVYGEQSVFKQILFILFKNAYDALLKVPKGQNRKITVTFEKSGGYALMTICDNGEPITPDVREKLFEPYFTTKGYDAGRGIGLFTAKSLITNFEDTHLYFDDSGGKCFVLKMKIFQQKQA